MKYLNKCTGIYKYFKQIWVWVLLLYIISNNNKKKKIKIFYLELLHSNADKIKLIPTFLRDLSNLLFYCSFNC